MPDDSPRLPGSRGKRFRWVARLALAALLASAATASRAADPVRGESLYVTAPAAGLLACFECHGERPSVNNFGNIFAGHNAVALIQRAVSFNTGGMGYFSAFYSAADLADIAAYLGNTPARLSFAETTTGSPSAAQRVTVSSGTKADIRNLSLSIEGDFAIASSDCGATVTRFERCSVDVTFRPSTVGERGGALLIAHDGTPTPVRIALSGTGLGRPPAVASLQPATLAFAAITPGAIAGPRQTLTLKNASDEPLAIAGASTSGPAFRIAGGDCTDGRTLGAGASCVLSVAFEPAEAGAATGELVIRHDGVGGESRAVLRGTAAAGTPAAWAAEPAQADFGSVEPLRRSAPRTLTLRNSGPVTISVDDVASDRPEFEVLAHDCTGAPLAPGAACRVVVAMRPARAGTVSGSLAVLGGGARVPVAVLLHGGGTATGVNLAAPARLDFAAAAGSAVVLSAQIVQRGAEPAVIERLAIEGTDAGLFEILAPAADGDCRPGLVLPPGAGCSVRIRYVAAGAGAHAARLRVDARGAVAATQVALSGRSAAGAVTAAWTVDASTLAFPGLPGTRTVTVRNLGPGPWRLDSARIVPAAGSGFAVRGGTCSTTAGTPAGASCTLEIGFEPLRGRAASATLVLQAQGSSAVAAVSLGGDAAAPLTPLLRFDTPLADFGVQPTGVPATRVLALRNWGAATAEPPLLEATEGFRIARVAPSCTAPLPAGARCDIELQWQPGTPGTARGALRARSGDTSTQAALTGTAAASAAALSWQVPPGEVSHDATRVGTRRAGAWRNLVNTSAVAVPLPRWQLVGPDAPEFSVDPASPCLGLATLAPGASCALRLVFHPQAPGVREAQLLASDDTPGLASLQLRATAHGQPLATLALQPEQLRFAAVPGTRTPPAFAWLANPGAAPVLVEQLEVLGAGFALGAPTEAGESLRCSAPPFALLPGQGCAVAVEWNGEAAGLQGGTLRAGADESMRAQVALAVIEDARDRQNAGAGGGAASVSWLLALAAATLWLARRRRIDAESRHGPSS